MKIYVDFTYQEIQELRDCRNKNVQVVEVVDQSGQSVGWFDIAESKLSLDERVDISHDGLTLSLALD